MKPRRQNISKGGLTISERVTRSMTRLHRSSLPVPDDLVFEIFSRLTLESVARCRCVCKLWSSILRRQDFTELFFTKSSARPQILFACTHYGDIHFFSSPQPENPEDNSYVVATNHTARFPRYYKLIGCTNGFFCYGADLGRRQRAVLVTAICNPSTRQSLILPRLNSRNRIGGDMYLGYDPIAKQFKVLSVLSNENYVMTLGTNRLSWRVVECCISHYPSDKWICISGVLFYIARVRRCLVESMVVCFDLRSEKFSFVNFLGSFNRALTHSTTMVNYNGRLGLLMSSEDDFGYVSRSSKSFELWILCDATKHEWSKHVYILPPLWKDVVVDRMCIAGMVGVNDIVLAPWSQRVPSYAIIYYNVKSKTIRKVGIQGMEAFQGNGFDTYLNYVENVKFL